MHESAMWNEIEALRGEIRALKLEIVRLRNEQCELKQRLDDKDDAARLMEASEVKS